MKAFKEYCQELEKITPETDSDHIPFFDKKEAKKTLLFVGADYDMEGIYKMLLPAWYLNMYNPDFRCLVAPPVAYDATKPAAEREIVLRDDFIEVATHIIFAFTAQSLKPIIEAIGAINAEAKIVMNIDFNYFNVPATHPLHKYFEEEATQIKIEQNIRLCNTLLFTNSELDEFFYNTHKTKLEGTGITLKQLPILIGMQHLDDLVRPKELTEKEAEVFRLLIITNETHFQDVRAFAPTLIKAKEKYGDKLEIIVLGSACVQNKITAFSKLKYTLVGRVPYFDYFQTIINLHPNMLLIPSISSEYANTSKNYTKYLEAALLGIPVVVRGVFPYNNQQITRHNEHAVVLEQADDLLPELGFAIDREEKFGSIAKRANETVLDMFLFDRKHNKDIYAEIFD